MEVFRVCLQGCLATAEPLPDQLPAVARTQPYVCFIIFKSLLNQRLLQGASTVSSYRLHPTPLQLPAGHLTPVLSCFILFSYGSLCRPRLLRSPWALVCWDKDSVLPGCAECLDSADQVRSLQFLLTGRKSGLIFFLHLSSSELS